MKSAVGGESTARKKKTATKKPAGEKTKSVIAKKKTGKACGEGVKKRVRKKEEEEMEEDSGVGEGEKEEKGEKTVKVVEKRTLRARAPAAKPRYTVSLLCVCVSCRRRRTDCGYGGARRRQISRKRREATRMGRRGGREEQQRKTKMMRTVMRMTRLVN